LFGFDSLLYRFVSVNFALVAELRLRIKIKKPFF
jgi:hypothetical protein